MAAAKKLKADCFPNTYGLVLCGGSSSRMGTDKSLLQYYEKPQRYHVYDMLAELCDKVYISCKGDQEQNMEPGYLFIPDHPIYINTGPMAALLTAFTKFPGKNMLAIGCDYPFLKTADLIQFSEHCKKDQPACFFNEQEDTCEPLLAWYPSTSFIELKNVFDEDQRSLRQILKNYNASKFYPVNKNSMLSIDSQEAFIKAFNTINP